MNLKNLFKKKKSPTKEVLIKQNKNYVRLIIISSIFMFFIMLAMYWIMFSPLEPVSRCMIYKVLGVDDFPGGLYYSNNYYCVWTKDKDLNWISYADYHEVCHHLTYWDKRHFCNMKYENDNTVFGFYNWIKMRDNYTKELNYTTKYYIPDGWLMNETNE